jgi:DNA-binding NarL/FixJ family response regulator
MEFRVVKGRGGICRWVLCARRFRGGVAVWRPVGEGAPVRVVSRRAITDTPPEDGPRPTVTVTTSALSGTGGGFGLTGLRERAELLGGTLHAEPAGTGWRVELRLPVPPVSGTYDGVPRLRVVVTDDQAIVREGLVTLLGLLPDIDVVGAAADGEQAVALTAQHAPDVVLMDLGMPRVDGVTATARIRAEYPHTQVVVLTTFADDTHILAALRAGALGFLTKDAGRVQIARALHTAATGQAVLDPVVYARLLAAVGDQAPAGSRTASLPDGLTAREADVLALIADGLTNTQIAGRLFVTEATVKTHINHIFTKAGLHDRTQAAAYAHRHHLSNP